MSLLSMMFIAVALGMDAFTVAVSAGIVIRKLTVRPVFRMSFHFGFFQFIMPIIGWVAGRTVYEYIVAFDHWVAFSLLACIGGKMIWDSIRDESETFRKEDPTRGVTLILLSIATSIDALAVGLSLAFLDIEIIYPSIIIGVVASVMTCAGMLFGERLGRIAGRKAGIFGGVILIGIGVKIIIEHLRLFQ